MSLCSITKQRKSTQSEMKFNDKITLNFVICMYSNYESPCKETDSESCVSKVKRSDLLEVELTEFWFLK